MSLWALPFRERRLNSLLSSVEHVGGRAHYLDHQNKHSGYSVDTKECSQLALNLKGLSGNLVLHSDVGFKVQGQGVFQGSNTLGCFSNMVNNGHNYLCSTLQRDNKRY